MDLTFADLEKNDVSSWYVQVVMNTAIGFFNISEFGGADIKYSQKNVDQGNSFYFVSNWQINFSASVFLNECP